jgi:hypothetical protein
VLKSVVIGKTYRNIKNQLLYRVDGIGLHTELGTLHVRYTPLYDSEYPEYYRILFELNLGGNGMSLGRRLLGLDSKLNLRR